VLVLASLLAGCVGFLRRPDPPLVTVADVTLASATLFEQRYVVRLRLQNPNPFALSLAGLDYSLLVNDRPFAAGVSNRPVAVPAYGTEVLDVDAYSSLGEILGQFRKLGEGIPRALHYRLKGRVRLKSPALDVPFDRAGELSLGPEEPKRGI
jgi:LEA14-like dessication related protein